MPRPTVATEQAIRGAVLALLAQAGVDQGPSPQSFRRAVSVRRVRERLGGGNPATIGRTINAVEAELVQSGLEAVALPDLPSDIAELMQQLWRAAVGVQLDDVARLRREAQALADGARGQLSEAELRADVLKQELAELRSTVADRDQRLAQCNAQATAQAEKIALLSSEFANATARETTQRDELSALRTAQAEALSEAQQRYEGLSRRLLEETAQQRQAAQGEVSRLTSQIKFAEKRQGTLEARVQQLEAELTEARSGQQQATGEVSALRYVNTSMRQQLDDLVRTLPDARAATKKLARVGKAGAAKAARAPAAAKPKRT